jgi:uncharacterized protein YgiM (DUF1202 family)
MKKLIACIVVTVTLVGSAIPARADYVCGLNPNGDNFLSLREGPGTQYREVIRMNPGTQLTVRSANGPWLYVEITLDGIVGWAYRRYVCR